MIYTITLNPALDRTLYVERLVNGEPCRVIKEERYPAGKGIDVSRVLLELGVESVAMGFLGGFTGKEIAGLLFNEGINMDFVQIKGETRTNIIIHTADGAEYVINAEGPEIEPSELAELYNIVKNIPRKPKYAILSGSLPRGISSRIYEQLTILFESRGAKVVVDSYGEPLKNALLATPFMIKPNKSELESVVGKKVESVEQIIDEANKIHKGGVECVVVSLKEEGAIGVSSDGVYWVKPPKIEAKNSVGAGDSLVAGMVAAFSWGKKFVDALAFGVASGTASALKPGTAKAKKNDILTILKEVSISKL